MLTRKLGRGGPEVSALGIGAMSFSDFYGPCTEAEAHGVLDRAAELGINHIDTSNIYGMGRSEQIIGRYFAHRPEMRDRFRIATKAGIRHDPETGERGFDNSRAHLDSELDASLERLGVEAVDLFYVHRRDPRHPIEAVTETLASLVAAGKAKAFGFSEIAPSSLRRAAAVHPVAAVQSEYSLSSRGPDLGLVQACDALGTALVAFAPVGRGLLTDTPPSADRAGAVSFFRSNPRFLPENLAANIRATDGFRKLAAEAGMPAAALAIGWLLARSDAVVPIPGTRSTAHLEDLALGAASPLAPDLLAEIEAVLPVGWAHGDRYSPQQWIGPERYC
ncbi:MAG: aldo/keto reductase [Rhodobacteraceae bacterium]|nr:aldo/keto reductase [Paracoccaceae bacterium]